MTLHSAYSEQANQHDHSLDSIADLDLVSSLYSRWDLIHEDLALANAQAWSEPVNHQQVELTEIWTYQRLKEEIERSASFLTSLGLTHGDVLGLQVPKSQIWLSLFLGALSQGISVLLLNDSYTARELIYYLSDAQAKVAFLPLNNVEIIKQNQVFKDTIANSIQLFESESIHCSRASYAPLCKAKRFSAQHLAVLAYTSGTTGQPKGARIRHADLMGTLKALHTAWKWQSDDVLVHTLPLFHIHGLFVAALGTLWAGAYLILLSAFDAYSVFKLIEHCQASVLMGVPTHHHRYLALARERSLSTLPSLKSLRLVTSGSAPLPAERFQELSELFGLEVVERYGMTEVGIVLSASLEQAKAPGSVGYPLPGVQAKVCDLQGLVLNDEEIGELHISSQSLFEGYHNKPKATEQSLYLDSEGLLWMRTGDLASRDQKGQYWLKGRRSDMIISGGLNVYPKEVEHEILLLADWIEEVAVVGLPDPEWGERVEAFYTTHDQKEPDESLSEQLKTLLCSVLASYKRPKRLRWMNELPRNALGKVQKFKLREL